MLDGIKTQYQTHEIKQIISLFPDADLRSVSSLLTSNFSYMSIILIDVLNIVEAFLSECL